MSTVTLLSAFGAKKAVEKLVEDIYELGKGQLGKQLSRWRAKSKIEVAYKRLKHIRNVKTIWQVEKEVDLSKFYYPTKVLVNDKPTAIDDLDDLPHKGNLVVEGIVGQGKSIFFRYLASRELVRARTIPLFVELRRIESAETLAAHLIAELTSLGFDTDQDTLNFLAEHGKLVLFLDGFDEVPEGHRSKLISEIEHFARRYEATRILISSRPNSGIAASTFFRVLQLTPLAAGDYEHVVYRLAHSDELSAQIVEGVKRVGERVTSLLTTPLMVALLVFRFKADSTIPENTAAFYDGLFLLLLQRHDKTKAGYVRPRASNLSDPALQDTFDALCYLTRKAPKGTFTLADMCELTRNSLDAIGVKGDPADVVHDIISITCLILEEGGECRYIHRSVQEYHAARFIKGRPDEIAHQFYKAMEIRWQAWRPELSFLEMLDRYRTLKWLIIPESLRVLRLQLESVPEVWTTRREHVLATYGALEVSFFGNATHISGGPSSFVFDRLPGGRFGFTLAVECVVGILHSVECISVDERRARFRAIHDPINGEGLTCTVTDVIEAGLLEKELVAATHEFFCRLHAELKDALDFVKREEATTFMFCF